MQNNLLKGWYFSNNIIFELKEGGTKAGIRIDFTPDSNWHHVVFSFDTSGTIADSKVQIYLDGELPTQNAIGGYGNSGCTESFRIGSANNTNYFTGKMSDFKIFKTDSPITLAQVQELYKKPENTPSSVQDNLLAWYPMIEGNPESPQSIVYDHSEKKLGSDTFVGLNQWSPKVVDRESVSVSGDEITLTIPTANDAGMSTGNLANLGLSTSLGYAVGDLVKLQFEGKITTNGSGFGETLRWYDTQEYVFSVTNISLTSEYQTFTFYGVISNLGYSIPYLLRMGSRTGTDIYKFKNFSVQKVFMGNHATTNFFGDMNDLLSSAQKTAMDSILTNASGELVFDNTDGDGTDQSGTNKWQIVAGTVTTVSDLFKVVNDGTTNGNVYIPFTTEVGKSYQAQASFYSSSLSANGQLSLSTTTSYNGSGYQLGEANSGTIITPVFTATGTTSYFHIRNASSGSNHNVHYDNMKVREVGISSSGFETAVNEPVVPQVPLMRYNQKMLFDGVDDLVTMTSGVGTVSAFTVSAWVLNRDSSQDSGVYRFGGTGSTAGNFTLSYSSNKYYLNIDDNDSNPVTAYAGVTNTNVDSIQHIVCIYNGTSALKIYINGVSQTLTASGTPPASIPLNQNLYIGKYYSGFWEGNVDEVSAFNTAFSDTEVQELFNDGVALDATTHSKKGNLLGYWRNDGVTTWKNRGDNFASFDGVNDVITRNAINVDYKSVSVWVRPSTTITTASSGVDFMFFGNWTFGSCRLGQATSDFTNELITITDNHGGGTKKTAWIPSSSETISSDSWTHIAFVWDGSKYVIYYNGQPQTVVTASNGHAPLNTNKNIRIGTGGASSSSFFDGDMANVAFWSESLTDAQVLSVYNSGHNGDISSIQSSDLELYYTFNPHASIDADTNSNVQDRSGNNKILLL